MPARNTIKAYAPDSYYHVYNRGASKQTIFHDDQDYEVFLGLLKRYLGPKNEAKPNRQRYVSYHGDVRLLAYCLMPNHFHLMLYQSSEDGMRGLMHRLTTSYVMYYNKKYHHTGVVFQQRYRAVRITDGSHLLHLSRYIHMNPKDYYTWPWSSLAYYIGSKTASWLYADKLPSVGDYRAFLDEYKERREELRDAKDEFAG
ncbi:hypothetical protein CR983_02575 [Candidatus Saccharibacteria bacterium]|nr:MAG: hypothetical protein CR983_02575 [Candidatus Saccharibacteria bacterium]